MERESEREKGREKGRERETVTPLTFYILTVTAVLPHSPECLTI